MRLRIADCEWRIEGHWADFSGLRRESWPWFGIRVVKRASGSGHATRLIRRVLPWTALFFTVFVPACGRRSARPAVPPPPPAALLRYEEAEKNFDAGDYAAAARSYEAYLQSGVANNLDRALFRAGLAYALAGDAADNASQSRALFQRLATQFPVSPYTPPANLILKLETELESLKDNLRDQQSKNKTLSEELRRLKDIDLRRKPTRPPQ